jgi:hypothetical protein
MTAERVPVSRGRGEVLVDAADLELVSQYRWHFLKGGYAGAHGKASDRTQTVLMHRLILDAPSDMQVDHINGDRLDNRRSNLRICTIAENRRNRRIDGRNNSTGFKGVIKATGYERWRAEIRLNSQTIRLGRFGSPEEAARAYDEAARKYHGEFARLNFSEAA